MKIYSLVMVLAILIMNNCKSDKNKPVAELAGIASIAIEKIANEATNMDILFYNLNVSLSQTDKGSLMQSAHFFAPTAKPQNVSCPSIGRLSFQKDGKFILEADIHFTPTCQYFTIIENKIAKGTNAMTKEGVYFINQILTGYDKPANPAPGK